MEVNNIVLIDLCARLPYGVFVGYEHYTDRHIVTTKLTGIRGGLYYDADGQIPNNELKPYLRPMSSMTKEERQEYEKTCFFSNEIGDINTLESYDWLNKKMFAYRTIGGKDMFELGIALRAPEGMYNF